MLCIKSFYKPENNNNCSKSEKTGPLTKEFKKKKFFKLATNTNPLKIKKILNHIRY